MKTAGPGEQTPTHKHILGTRISAHGKSALKEGRLKSLKIRERNQKPKATQSRCNLLHSQCMVKELIHWLQRSCWKATWCFDNCRKLITMFQLFYEVWLSACPAYLSNLCLQIRVFQANIFHIKDKYRSSFINHYFYSLF